MDRLTIKNSDGSYSQPTHTTFEKMFYKLSALEDVLEEFGIESAEGLRVYIKNSKYYNSDLLKENEELKSQLSKAIVSKFEIGQECWYVFNRYQREPIRCVIDRIYYDSDKNCKLRYDTSDSCYGGYGGCKEEHLFPTQAEAQAKLDEIRRKEDVWEIKIIWKKILRGYWKR